MKVVEEKPEQSEKLTNSEMLVKMQAQIDELTKQKENAPKGSNETVEAITALVEQMKERPDEEKYGGEDSYTRAEDIDPEDIIPYGQGVTFFSHHVAYVIVDDKRNGHNVRTPFHRAIKFVYQSTRTVKHGKENILHNLSAYTSHSKAEIKWLQEHKFFGTIFFTSHKDAMNIDVIRANKLARIIITLQRVDVSRIIKMASDLGIPQSDDVNVLRIAIAHMQVETQMKAEEQANAVRVKEAIIEKDILAEKT